MGTYISDEGADTLLVFLRHNLISLLHSPRTILFGELEAGSEGLLLRPLLMQVHIIHLGAIQLSLFWYLERHTHTNLRVPISFISRLKIYLIL